MHVAHVVERELTRWGGDSKVGEEIAAARPQPPLERVLHRGGYEGFEKLTFGTCVASGGASKNG